MAIKLKQTIGASLVNQTYYVAFKGTKGTGLYTHFEKDGFNHCFVFYPELGKTINDATYFHITEHLKTFVSCGMVERDSLEAYLQDAIVLEVRTRRTVRAKWWWWIPTPDTCVTITKQILGIHKPFMWSPYQLYKHIIKEMKWAEL